MTAYMIQTMLSVFYYVCSTEPVAGAEVIIESGAEEFFEGRPLELRCTLTAGNHVSYKWLVNGKAVIRSPLHNVAKDQLFIDRSTISH